MRPSFIGACATSNGGGGSYTGPLDIVSGAVIAYGQRALSSAMRGQPLYTIRRDSDDTTQAFNSDAMTGDAPISGISSFIGGGSGFVATWNDQSGNAHDVSQASGIKQPAWRSGLINARPGLDFSAGAAVKLFTASEVSFGPGGFTIFAVAFGGSTDLPRIAIMGQGWNTLVGGATVRTSYPALNFEDADDNTEVIVISTVGLANDIRLFEFFHDNAVSPTAGIVIDGTVRPINAPVSGYTGLSYALTVGNDSDPADDTSGTPAHELLELIVYNSSLSAPDRLAICQNIAPYYGITLS